jgi:hypothetical protein
MTRKYTPPKKKRSHPSASSQARTSGAAPTAVHTPEISMARPAAAATSPLPATGSEAVKYENLPWELRRVALLSAITIVILIVSWLIFR